MLGVFTEILGPPRAVSNADANLNRQAADYVGREFTLVNSIVGGHGRLTIGAGTWLIGGPDLPAGSRIRVVAVEGPRLHVTAG